MKVFCSLVRRVCCICDFTCLLVCCFKTGTQVFFLFGVLVGLINFLTYSVNGGRLLVLYCLDQFYLVFC